MADALHATPTNRQLASAMAQNYVRPRILYHLRKLSVGRRSDPASLSPLTSDQAVDAIFSIQPEDVNKVLASKRGEGKKK